jgi:hypothetical protein
LSDFVPQAVDDDLLLLNHGGLPRDEFNLDSRLLCRRRGREHRRGEKREGDAFH